MAAKFVLKSRSGGFIIAAPRNISKEGCLCGPREYAALRLVFDTAELAREWLRDLRQRQIAAGCRSYQLAGGYPVSIDA